MIDTVMAIAKSSTAGVKGKGKAKKKGKKQKSTWGRKKNSRLTTLAPSTGATTVVSAKGKDQHVNKGDMSETTGKDNKDPKMEEVKCEKMDANKEGRAEAKNSGDSKGKLSPAGDKGEKSGNGGKRKLSSAGDDGSLKRRFITAENINSEADVVSERASSSGGWSSQFFQTISLTDRNTGNAQNTLIMKMAQWHRDDPRGKWKNFFSSFEVSLPCNRQGITMWAVKFKWKC